MFFVFLFIVVYYILFSFIFGILVGPKPGPIFGPKRGPFCRLQAQYNGSHQVHWLASPKPSSSRPIFSRMACFFSSTVLPLHVSQFLLVSTDIFMNENLLCFRHKTCWFLLFFVPPKAHVFGSSMNEIHQGIMRCFAKLSVNASVEATSEHGHEKLLTWWLKVMWRNRKRGCYVLGIQQLKWHQGHRPLHSQQPVPLPTRKPAPSRLPTQLLTVPTFRHQLGSMVSPLWLL